MSEKTYVVEHGMIGIPDGDAKYKGALVTDKELGDQVDRHIKNGAIREATKEEVKAGMAAVAEEPTLEAQQADEETKIEASKARIESLKTQMKARDERDAKAMKARKEKEEADAKLINASKK